MYYWNTLFEYITLFDINIIWKSKLIANLSLSNVLQIRLIFY